MNLEDINASIRELEARLLVQEIERAGIEGTSSILHSTPKSAKALRPPRQSDSGFTTMQSVRGSAAKGTAMSNQGSASKRKSVQFANKAEQTPQGKQDSDDIRYDLSKYLQQDEQSRSDPDTNVTVRRKQERSQNELTHEKSAVKIKPATYDGTSSWLDYKSHFEACAKLGNWNEEEKGLYLSVSLRGLAQGILGNLNTDKQLNYNELVRALSDRFAPPDQMELYRIQLKERRQKASESGLRSNG